MHRVQSEVTSIQPRGQSETQLRGLVRYVDLGEHCARPVSQHLYSPAEHTLRDQGMTPMLNDRPAPRITQEIDERVASARGLGISKHMTLLR